MTDEVHHDLETRLGAYLAELSAAPPPPGLAVVERRRNLPPRRWLPPGWAVVAVLGVGVISAVTFAYHRVSTGAPQSGGAASSAPSTSQATRVTRVEISVPNSGLTFQVARGTVLALHLHLRNGTATSPWGAGGSFTGSGYDFAAIQIPYPGNHPKASPSDYYVAYRIQGVGTAGIGIEVPSTCTNGGLCPAPLEVITVRAVASPLTTATVTGELTRQCGFGCVASAPDATISFRDQTGRSVLGAKTDVGGDYFAELPPGTWHVSTTPTAQYVQQPTLTVVPGDITIDDVEVNPPGSSPTESSVATKTFELTLRGPVAPDDNFGIFFPEGSQTGFDFCAPIGPVCMSGKTYTRAFSEAVSSTPRPYRFEKATADGHIQVLSQGQTTFDSSSTIVATFP